MKCYALFRQTEWSRNGKPEKEPVLLKVLLDGVGARKLAKYKNQRSQYNHYFVKRVDFETFQMTALRERGEA